jgi:hypothetical protein
MLQWHVHHGVEYAWHWIDEQEKAKGRDRGAQKARSTKEQHNPASVDKQNCAVANQSYTAITHRQGGSGDDTHKQE